ncbi:gpi anchored protein [Rutstroemia sp. NJR-2017a BVV2]|nr:gpi anchored protein [Rutstroemia sp. NJR-2017a BVV2]
MKNSPGDFNHPGLWHSHDDLERMRTNVIAGNDPWKSAFDKFSVDKYSLANYTMQGPKTVLVRGTGSNYTNFTQDGDMFANAAEIMRWEGGWLEAGAKWQGGNGFSIQLYCLFARQSIINGQANYGMVSIKALLSFAVYLDDVIMVMTRDQGHAQSGLAWTAEGAHVIKNQGHGLKFPRQTEALEFLPGTSSTTST